MITQDAEISVENDEARKTDGFDVTFVGRMKHGVIYNAIKMRKWTVAEAAEFLGITATDVYGILGLKRLPPYVFSKYRKVRPEIERRAKRIEEKLMELTGKTVEELFPEEVRSEVFLGRSHLIVVNRKASPNQLLELAQGQFAHQLEAPTIPSDAVDEAAKFEVLSQVLGEICDDRERIIFEKYCNGEKLGEIGQALGVTRSRADQILSYTLDKIRNDPRITSFSQETVDELTSIRLWAKRNAKRVKQLLVA